MIVGNIIAFIVIGLVAGWIASELMRGRGLGIVGDIVIGIIGALIGGNIFALFGVSTAGFWSSLLAAVVGAVILLFLISLIPKSPAAHHR